MISYYCQGGFALVNFFWGNPVQKMLCRKFDTGNLTGGKKQQPLRCATAVLSFYLE